MAMKKTSAALVGLWLILNALLPLLRIDIPNSSAVLAVLGIAAGISVIVEGDVLRLPTNLGLLALGAWLVLVGVIRLFDLGFPYSGLVVAGLGLAAGILILLRR